MHLSQLYTIRKYGTSYAIATTFFPKHIRDKVLLLYSFVRKPDNIVDQDISHLTQQERRQHYGQVKTALQNMLQSREDEYAQWISEYAILFHENKIPFEYSKCFYEAMIHDCNYSNIATYKQLERYMYGSAVVVGYMMNNILGVDDIEWDSISAANIRNYIQIESWSVIQKHAMALAQAMQLTNFLRDIKEDFVKLNRIYIPIDIQDQFNIDSLDIIAFCRWKSIDYSSPKRHNFTMLMKDLIAKCRELYREAEQGYHYLPDYATTAISLAGTLYEWILDKIEKNHYDVFTKSARTSLFDKYKIIRLWKQKQLRQKKELQRLSDEALAD